MIFSLEKKDIEELKTTEILPQTPFWGRVKSEQVFLPAGFELIISRKLLLTNASPSKKRRTTY